MPMASKLACVGRSCECGGSTRVLSIQSHVVSGCKYLLLRDGYRILLLVPKSFLCIMIRLCARADVGNKAAVFPLQLLGFDVDIINSVQFSNHTGYPFGWEGEVLDGSKLEKLIDGMERNGLLSSSTDSSINSDERIGNILTGYIGSESFLTAVVNVVQKLKRSNPKCRYICDPVLGDMGRFYVPKELVDIYRRDVLPLADVITPNQFEVEQLTRITIRSIHDAQRACRFLHDVGVQLVLITSIVFSDDVVDTSGDCSNSRDPDVQKDQVSPPPNDSIGMFTSRRKCSSNNMSQIPNVLDDGENEAYLDEQYIVYTPRLAGQFTGTGDVCAALFLGLTSDSYHDANTSEDSTSLACSLEKLAGTCASLCCS